MDHHVPRAITNGLRLRRVEVLTAHEEQASELPDPELLDRATALGRVSFTQDDDLVMEAAQRQRRGQPFAGVIYAHQLRISVGISVGDLELVAKAGKSEDMTGQTLYLPL